MMTSNGLRLSVNTVAPTDVSAAAGLVIHARAAPAGYAVALMPEVPWYGCVPEAATVAVFAHPHRDQPAGSVPGAILSNVWVTTVEGRSRFSRAISCNDGRI